MQTVTSTAPTLCTDRTAVLLQESRVRIYEKTDRLFARLLVLQWLAGIAVALLISPRTWIGDTNAIHVHVWAAVFLGGAIASLPFYLAWKQPGQVLNRHVIAAAQMLSSGLLIHLSGGRIETHFHIFGSLAFLAFYRDWRVLITATAVTTADHMLRGWLWPQSIFGVFTPTHWRWIEHASWVVFEDVFLFISIRLSNREMGEVAQRSELETAAQSLSQAQQLTQTGSWEWAAETNAATWSTENFRLFGIAPGMATVTREFQLNCVHPDDREAARAWTDQAMNAGEVAPTDFRIVRPDGEVRVLQNRATSEFGKDGKVSRVLGTSQDVTEARRAEAALRESERTQREIASELEVERARLLAAQAAGKIGSWELDLLTGKVSWSEETHRIFETNKDQFRGTHEEFLAVVHPEDRVPVQAALASSSGEPGSHSFEHRLLLADGRITFVEERWQLIHDDQDQPIRAVGTCQDITERKRAEQIIEQTLQRLNDAQRLGRMGDWDLDLANEVVIWSPQVFEIVGRDPRLGPPRDYKEVEASFDLASQKVMAERVTLATESGEEQEYELRVCRPDGAQIEVLAKAMARMDQNGRVVGLHGTIQDITERKKSEAALKESEEWLRAIFEASRDGLIVEDGGTVRYVNTAYARILGYDTAAELVGRPVSELLPANEARRLAEYEDARVRGENPPTFYEFKGKRKNGSLVQVEASVSTCVIAGRQYIATAIRDITDRKLDDIEREKINMLLLDTSRQAGMAEVATSVLHNVGNVLNSVNVSCSVISDTVRRSRIGTVAKTAELLQEHAADLPAFFTSDPVGRSLPEFVAKLAQRLTEEQALVLSETHALGKNIEHIREIVSVQQDYAKNIAGVRETLTVRALVEDALRMNSAALIRHRVELIRDFADTPALRVEKHKVLQILVNLIRNAKHALVDSDQPHRRLTVRIGASDGHVAVSVSDNGIGILPENLTRVFTHGFTTKKAGHGFGLHNGVLAAQQMGGSLRVQSDGFGCGATFTLELPRIPEGATS